MGKSFGGMGDYSFLDKMIMKAYEKNDYDKSGTIDTKEAYIALLSVYDKVNKLAPFYIKPPKYLEMLMYCKKADVNGDELSLEEFKSVCKMVIGGDTGTWRRSLWFRVVWHALLELVLFAATAEFICKVVAEPLELDFMRPSVVAVFLKVGYKVASMLANKQLLDD